MLSEAVFQQYWNNSKTVLRAKFLRMRQTHGGLKFRSLAGLVMKIGSLKVPITPSSVMKLESQIREIGVKHHYSIACNLVWIASNQTEDLTSISSILERCKLTGVLVRGYSKSLYGFHRKLAIHDAIKQTMDSEGKFPDLL